jgi:ribA/ribD-fused uncharacterized protein
MLSVSATAPVPRDVDALRALVDGGGRVKYLFFWGHRPRRDAAVGTECLSQWWPAAFVVDGVRYASAEHYMMVGKALLFGDESIAQRMLATSTPGAVKALGRQVPGFDEATWDAHRFGLVTDGNVAKFGQHPELRDYLLRTGDRVLVEASPVDRIWGIGLTAADPRASDPSHWRGRNLLGFALMRAREILAGTTSPARRA